MQQATPDLEQYVYVGIRRRGVWTVKRAERLAEQDLRQVDLLNDFQSVITCVDDLSWATYRIVKHAAEGRNPFRALVASDYPRSDAAPAIECVKAAARVLRKTP